MGEAITAGELTEEANKAYHQEDFLAAAKAYQAASLSYLQGNDPLLAAEMSNNASVAYLRAEKPDSALQNALQTDEVFAEASDFRRQAIALANQAAAYEALGKLTEAEKAYQSSSELLKQLGDQELRPTVLKSLSAVQLRLGNQMEAIATMKTGLDQVNNPGIIQRLMNKFLKIPFNYFNRIS
jgi:tetratricopeptide (TPR) repeat protein